jgi:hypothetical protein
MSARTDLSGWPAARAAAVARVEDLGARPTQANVAAVLGTSRRTLRTRDDAAGIARLVAQPLAEPHEHTCQGCGQPLVCRAGTHRKWHSEACRVAAFRRAHPARLEQLRCKCGATYTHRRGRGQRPRACAGCRAQPLLRKALAILAEAQSQGGSDARPLG